MSKITACLVLHNEERTIRRCLESLKGAVQELVVVHDGECRDKTLDICREYTDKIFVQRPHQGFMEAHVPFAISQASGDWIIRIDGDEFLSDELRNRLSDLVSDPGISAYRLLWPYFDGDRQLSSSWPYKLCLFKKDKVSFLGILHFLPQIDGRVAKSDFVLHHRPEYNNFSWPVFRSKWLFWADLQARSYFKDIDDISKFNYQGSVWPKVVAARKNIPLFLLPLDFGITFIKNLRPRPIRHFWLSVRIALMFACYRAAVDFYIFKYKNERDQNINNNLHL